MRQRNVEVKKTKWIHGSVEYRHWIVWVQKVSDGTWFSKIEHEDRKLMIVSGPWPTQWDAEQEITDGLEHLFVQPE